MNFDIESLAFDKGLLPVIIQHAGTGEVLMTGFTNREAVLKTLETKTAWFYSRSRQALWNKGETSGNYLLVKEIRTDCDRDALLYRCIPKGPVCHTGENSCFFNLIYAGTEEDQ